MSAILIAFFSNPQVQIVLVTALVAGTTWIGRHAVALVKAKAAGSKYEGGLLRITTAVTNAVLCVEQTLLPEILAAKSETSEGGTKITDAEGARLFGAAEKAVVEILGGSDKIDALCKEMGVTRGMFDALVCNMIEATVQKLSK